MTKWEYLEIEKEVQDYDYNNPDLRQLGQEGWELVSTTSYKTKYKRYLYWIFKRPIND